MATDDEGPRKGRAPFSGFIEGLTDFVDKLNQLAEKGQQLQKTGSFKVGGTGEGQKPASGVYGFSVKMGLGGEAPKVEPFGNIRRDQVSGEPVVEDVREPLVDVFDEGDHLMVLAEMPGVEAEDIKVDVDGSQMSVSGERGPRKYRKRFELPATVVGETLKMSAKNGIVEITCAKTGAPHAGA